MTKNENQKTFKKKLKIKINNLSVTLDNFYSKTSKKIKLFRMSLCFLFLVIIISSTIIDNSNYKPDDIPYFLYFTHLSCYFVTIYYLLWTLTYIFKLEKLAKHLNNFHIVSFVQMFIWITGIVYMFFIFGPLLYGYATGSFVPTSFSIWILYALLAHFVIPVFSWIEFRSAKYPIATNKVKFPLVLTIYVLLYGLSTLIYGYFTQVFPYPFLDYRKRATIVMFAVPTLMVLVVVINYFFEDKYMQRIILINNTQKILSTPIKWENISKKQYL